MIQMRCHIVMYANGEPFETTKKLTLASVDEYTKKDIVIHDYNPEKIKQSSWFSKIKDLPLIKKIGYRDGYYNVYKAFCCLEVYNLLEEGDVLFYLDSSQYYVNGFTQNIDRLCDIAVEKGFIAGSVGDDIMNDMYQLCHKFEVWKKILPECDMSILKKRHILNSWFILTKNTINEQFMNDWVYWCMYADEEFPEPLITYHLTGDQSIFNPLVHKYKLPVFYDKNRYHCLNKDKNGVLEVINNAQNVDDYFILL